MFCVPPVSGSTSVTSDPRPCWSRPALQRGLVVVGQGRQLPRVVGHADIVSGLTRRHEQVLPFHGRTALQNAVANARDGRIQFRDAV